MGGLRKRVSQLQERYRPRDKVEESSVVMDTRLGNEVKPSARIAEALPKDAITRSRCSMEALSRSAEG